MLNFFKKLFHLNETVTVSPVAPAPAPSPAPSPAPPAPVGKYSVDENGFADLSGAITNPDYAGYRFQVEEITKLLKGDQLGSAQVNLFNANGLLQISQMVGGTGIKAESYKDDAGNVHYRAVNPQVLLPKTRSLPGTVYTSLLNGKTYDLSTVAGAVTYINDLPRAVKDDGSAFLPH